jgi:rhodanese-related sulfurtransferase
MRYFLIAAACSLVVRAEHPYRIIDLNETKYHYNAHDALFVDARDSKMYAKGTIMRALNIPLKRFKRMEKWLPVRKDAPLLIFCNGPKCDKSIKLAERFAKVGYADLMVYRAGYPEWKRYKLPIMSAPRPCRCDGRPYTPVQEPAVVQGAKLYLDHNDPSRVDARWFAQSFKQKKLPPNIQLVDVRPKDQFLEGHIEGAVNIPYHSDKKSINADRFSVNKAIIFYCNHGSISAEAYDALPQDIAARTKVLEADLICNDHHCTLVPN